MLEDKFKKYIKEHSLVGPDDRLLLTVSGGVDSMVMMSLFAGEGYDIAVAHCNFQLRGEESDQDEVLVAEQARRYGVPHYNRRFDTQAEMDLTGESVQIAARRLRYEWFEELCRIEGYTSIAIAHHADDSIETFFINLFRGTGLKGLTGIHRVNGRIIRPLLFASRREILEYAHEKEIPFREDSSNRSTKYLRNKIRLGIVPVLRDVNPNFTHLMASNIDRLTDAQLFIDRCIESIHNEVVTTSNGTIVIDPRKIDPGLPLGFVIYEIMSAAYGFRGEVVDSLVESLARESTGRRFYSKDYVAYIDRSRILVARIERGDSCEVTLSQDRAKIYFAGSVMLAKHTDIDNVAELRGPANVALLDEDKLTFPLTIRKWEHADSFVPLGMSGRKKVSDFLIDEKVSMPAKDRQFVVLSGTEIVWVIGRRIDDRYKVTPQTENILRLQTELL